jgi:hypothetical protein
LREPAAAVMDQRQSGQSSDSESRSLRTAGLGQPAGQLPAAPLACSYWSEERDVRLSRLDRVEGCGDNGKPGRTSENKKSEKGKILVLPPDQDVPLLEI